MSAEWKPGQIAMVRDTVCMYLGQRGWEHGRDDSFAYRADIDDIRPLVVIDPEDREQVERFRDLASRFADDVPYSDGEGAYTTAMQAALREFASPTPPRPAEPLGLGAVVEATIRGVG